MQPCRDVDAKTPAAAHGRPIGTGPFLTVDVRAASAPEDDIGDPIALLLPSAGTLHCLRVSFADDGAGAPLRGTARVPTIQIAPDDDADELRAVTRPRC